MTFDEVKSYLKSRIAVVIQRNQTYIIKYIFNEDVYVDTPVVEKRNDVEIIINELGILIKSNNVSELVDFLIENELNVTLNLGKATGYCPPHNRPEYI